MKKVVPIVSALIICIALSLTHAYSNTEKLAIPSEQTWSEIQDVITPASEIGEANVPSLRAAPPDGPSIGETPAGDTSLFVLVFASFGYFIFRGKLKNKMHNKML